MPSEKKNLYKLNSMGASASIPVAVAAPAPPEYKRPEIGSAKPVAATTVLAKVKMDSANATSAKFVGESWPALGTPPAPPTDMPAAQKKRKVRPAKDDEIDAEDLSEGEEVNGDAEEEEEEEETMKSAKKQKMPCQLCGTTADTRNTFRCGHLYLCKDHIKTDMPNSCPECGKSSVSTRFRKDFEQYMNKAPAPSAAPAPVVKKPKVAAPVAVGPAIPVPITVDDEMDAVLATFGFKPTRCTACYPVDALCKGGEPIFKSFVELMHHLGDKHKMFFVRGQTLADAYKFAKNSPWGEILRL